MTDNCSVPFELMDMGAGREGVPHRVSQTQEASILY